jgi:hypothetical protein
MGVICAIYLKGDKKTKVTKSYIRGSVNMLMAYAELQQTWQHPCVQALVEYFLCREGLFQTIDPSKMVNSEVGSTLFPFTWRASIL